MFRGMIIPPKFKYQIKLPLESRDPHIMITPRYPFFLKDEIWDMFGFSHETYDSENQVHWKIPADKVEEVCCHLSNLGYTGEII